MGSTFVGAGLLALGLSLATVGLHGLLRKSDIFEQPHAAGLATGPAIILVLLASVAAGNRRVITSAILLALSLLITAPLSTHALAQAAHRRALGESSPTTDEDDVGEADSGAAGRSAWCRSDPARARASGSRRVLSTLATVAMARTPTITASDVLVATSGMLPFCKCP